MSDIYRGGSRAFNAENAEIMVNKASTKKNGEKY
jgi:hypothetical protein